MAAQQMPQWEGKSIANLKGLKAEQVWPLFEDFFNFHKWLPTIDTCYQVNDDKDRVIRCCANTVPPSSDGGEATIKWCHERLLMVDKIERCLSYEALDNNMGIRSYVAMFKVLSSDDGDESGCQIEWSFVADPVDGLTLECFLGYVDFSLQSMAEKIEKALESSEVIVSSTSLLNMNNKRPDYVMFHLGL